jgi:predicted ABC-type ATPase
LIGLPDLDARPILVAVAGPNGAGKTTFYHSQLRAAGLRFVNADVLAAKLGLEPYEAAKAAADLREELLRRRESFVFETVFSDPAGEKLAFLSKAAGSGYAVLLCFIGLASPRLSLERVAMRTLQGGHDVPGDKLRSRYPRILANLKSALRSVASVLVYDNSDLRRPYRLLAVYRNGRPERVVPNPPAWLKRILPK